METFIHKNQGKTKNGVGLTLDDPRVAQGGADDKLLQEESVLQPSSVKKCLPLMGNFVYRVDGPVVDKERLEFLGAENPAVLDLLRESRKKYLEYLGVDRFSEIRNQSHNEELAKRIRENIAKNLVMKKLEIKSYYSLFHGINMNSFPNEVRDRLIKNSEKHDLGEALGMLNEIAIEADSIVRGVIKSFFPSPGSDSDLGITSDISNEHDVGKLALIACDERIPARNRCEALRKLAIMEGLVELHGFEKIRKKGNSDLSYFFRAMNKIGIYNFNADDKLNEEKENMIMGAPNTKYLVTRHDPQYRSCDHCEVYSDEKEAQTSKRDGSQDLVSHVTPIPVREFRVKDSDGNERVIEGVMDDRMKERSSMFLKSLRKDSLNWGRMIKDLNGMRFSFADEKEADMFISALESQLKEHGYYFEVVETDDNVGGGRLACRQKKYKIDNRLYEMQIFTHKQYADYLYKYPWGEYEIDRFFDSSSSEAFFPKDIFPKIDREKSRKLAKDRYRLMINGNNGRTS